MPDPLVAEIAERASARPAAAALHDEAAILIAQESSASEELTELHELADLDEQLQRLTGGSGTQPAHDGTPDNQNVPGRRAVLELMRSVQLPTARALASASLEPLRGAILRLSEEQDAHRWATYHVFLGGALKLRAHRRREYQRANFLIEATRAFDVAYSVYAPLYSIAHSDCRLAGHSTCAVRVGEDDRVPGHRRAGFRPYGICAGERDGTLLIARAVSDAMWEKSDLLERAVTSLRLARASADVNSWIWVSSTNNLACALTLLAKRTPAAAGGAMLREATRVLHEVLKSRAEGLRREDRASTLINLAEALLSMAERETPRMRLTKIERAFAASSAALLTVIPSELAWLVRLECSELV